MPEASQYLFAHKELVELMIKKAGIHEGKWVLLVNFGFTAINGGPSPDQMVPAAVVGVQSIGIQKAALDSPSGLVVDAGEVNPAEEVKPKGKKD